jgi:hypothetical protein
MSKQIRLPSFWLLAALQAALAIAVSATWFYFRTKAYLAGLPDPDTYAWSWDFQWMVFGVFWLPTILLCTAFALAIERTALISYYRAGSHMALPQHRQAP